MQEELIECWERFNHLREALDGSSMYLANADLCIADISLAKYLWLTKNTETLALFFPQARQINVFSSDSSFFINPNDHLKKCISS